MANFTTYIPILTVAEGGFQKNLKDNGNWTGGKEGSGTLAGTNFGISAALYQRLYPDKDITETVMRNLTKPEALDIYKTHFWGKHRFAEIDSQPIANNMMDMALNAGPYTSIRLIQIELNALGENLNADGIIGARTLSAINRQTRNGNEAILYNRYTEARRNFYQGLNNATFGTGLNNRLNNHFPPMTPPNTVSSTVNVPNAPNSITVASDYITHTTRSIFNVTSSASVKKELLFLALIVGLILMGLFLVVKQQMALG